MTKKSPAVEVDHDLTDVADDSAARRASAARRIERLEAAKAEWSELKAWTKAGKVGDAPATPTLTQLQEEQSMPASQKKAARSTKSTTPRSTLAVSYVVNGKIMAMTNRAYTLGYLAFEHTADIDPKQPKRITTAETRAMLASLGVADANVPFAPVTFPNGKVVEAIALGSTEFKQSAAAPKSSKPKAEKPAPVVAVTPVEKANTPRARAAKKVETKAAKSAAKKAPAKSTPSAKREVTPIPKKTRSTRKAS